MQIVYHAHINHTGYSVAAQDYILAMLSINPELNIRLKYLNLRHNLGVSEKRQQTFAKLSSRTPETDSTYVFHSIPAKYSRPPGSKKCIGVCLFEAFNPPKDWIRKMNEMDLIITASQFNKNIFEAAGAKVPIVVIPHCFDTELFNASVKPKGRYATKTIMSMGTWKARKNWDQLIKGFYDAFEKKDGVCLLLKTDKTNELQSAVRRIKHDHAWRSKDTAPIFADQASLMTFEDIPAYMKKADYCVSTSLGEGFGLFPFQGMALGIPVCVTKCTGVTEYAKPEHTTYFHPHSYHTIPTMDGLPQFANCIWPSLQVSEISTKLREIVSTDNSKKVKLGYDFVHENFNYNKIGQQFLKAVTNV